MKNEKGHNKWKNERKWATNENNYKSTEDKTNNKSNIIGNEMYP